MNTLNNCHNQEIIKEKLFVYGRPLTDDEVNGYDDIPEIEKKNWISHTLTFDMLWENVIHYTQIAELWYYTK